MIQTIDANERSKWPHRVAVLLVCATFPLIWVGGLVTTYDAGMAVPDWPNTYGYNLFLYPVSTWLSGPWDLFIEHGHRLLASIVGLITIGFVAVTWRFDSRVWFRRFSLVCLALVITQGVLGGLRVVLDENVLARLHGCVGPLFFVTTVVSAAFASRWWQEQETSSELGPSPTFIRTAWLTVGLIYVQLILGAHLRHMNPSWPPRVFSTFVIAHLFVAAAILIHSLGLVIAARRIKIAKVRRLTTTMLLLVVAQLILGAGAWRMRYNWPDWLPQPQSLVGYTVTAESMSQTITITGHVALGSLILAAATLLAVRSSRVGAQQPEKVQPVRSRKLSASRLEVVA